MPKEDPFVNRAQLLKAIKKYPEIWDSNNKLHMCRSVTAPMWNEIAEQFGGHVPTVKLQSIWSQMKYHYHNLVHRQILHKDRFTTKWEHFEPMSFMYNITVAKIVGAAANTAATGGSIESSSGTGSVGVGPVTSGLVPSTPPPPPSPLPLPLPPSTTIVSSTALPPLAVSPVTPTLQNRGRPSGSYAWLSHPSANVTPTQLEINVETTPYTAFTGLVPPAVVTVETTTTPMRKVGRPGALNNSMRARIIDCIRNHPSLWAGRQPAQPQPQTPQPASTGRGSNGERQSQNRTSAVWKEVAAELGLTPSLVQTRWSIIKQRYVDELQKERHALYAQHGFQSTWEHFDRMSFMREILSKKVDEREQTREQIQEIVSEQHQQQQQQQQNLRYVRNSSGSASNGGGNSATTLANVSSMALSSHAPHLAHETATEAAGVGAVGAVSAAAGLMLMPTSSSAAMLHAGAATLYHPQPHHPAHAHHHLQYHPIAAHHHHHAAHATHHVPAAHHPAHVASFATAMSGSRAAAAAVAAAAAGGRRVKTENDLEWDPFEMILHVQGPEVTHN